MDQLKLWILGGAVSILLVIAGFLGKLGVTQVTKRLEDILDAIRQLTNISTRHESEMHSLRKDQDKLSDDVDELEGRVREVEKHHAVILRRKIPDETL